MSLLRRLPQTLVGIGLLGAVLASSACAAQSSDYPQSGGGYARDDRSPEGYQRRSDSGCETKKTDHAVLGGVVGALAGAVIGSNLASGGGRTGGAVIGGVAGAAVGANVGRGTVSCDPQGAYYSYDQTYPYRNDAAYDGDRRHDSDWYVNNRCRMAPAPGSRDGDNRYVRVCPDRDGRFRYAD